MTGTNPDWNKIIIEKCERSPEKLKELISNDQKVRGMFSDISFDPKPVLIRKTEEGLKMLDGMHRLIGAIKEGEEKIAAYIAVSEGEPKPDCEPHTVYDLIRAYHRGTNKDRQGLITALRYLRKSYANVDHLLKTRFNEDWITDEETLEAIKEALKD